jgi:hypothetical protein
VREIDKTFKYRETDRKRNVAFLAVDYHNVTSGEKQTQIRVIGNFFTWGPVLKPV